MIYKQMSRIICDILTDVTRSSFANKRRTSLGGKIELS